MKSQNLNLSEIDHLCLKIGKFIEYWGFKEIEGRIWCHLLLAQRPLCPSDLINRTGVSKGLISIALSRMIEYNVIRLEHKEGRRTQFYQINENVTQVIKGVLNSREKNMLLQIEQAVHSLEKLPMKKLNQINLDRLKFLKRLVKTASFYLNILLIGGEKVSSLVFDKAPIVKPPLVRNYTKT